MTSDCGLHGTVIKYSDIDDIAKFRNDFLDPEIRKKVSKTIKDKAPVYFLPNTVGETHIGSDKYDKTFKIYMIGILNDGRKALVILNDIKPFFYVRVHKDFVKKPDQFLAIVLDELKTVTQEEKDNNRAWLNKKMFPVDTEIVYKRRLKEFEPEKHPYIKLIYDNNQNRINAIRKLQKIGKVILGHDDVTHYHRVFSRDNDIPLSKWVTLNNYERTHEQVGEFYMTSLYSDALEENTFVLSYRDYKTLPKEHIEYEELKDDRSLVCAWDTEVYSSTGNLPAIEVQNDELMVISLVFFQAYNKVPFFKVALSLYPVSSNPDYLTVVCGTEEKLLKAYGKFMNIMKPDFIEGFNDMSFDTPWIYGRAAEYHPGLITYLYFHTSCMISDYVYSAYKETYKNNTIEVDKLIEFGQCKISSKKAEKVDEYVTKTTYLKKELKLEAGRNHEGYIWNVAGLINMDVRPIFMQIYPTAEQSNLNFYLSENKLPPKNDMQITQIFMSYDVAKKLPKTKYGYDYKIDPDNKFEVDNVLTSMHEIVNYCVIDSQRSRELMQQRLILQEKREFANLTSVSLFDSIYFANGAKVINVVAGFAERESKFDITFSNSYNEDRLTEKFSGAFVDNPIKGVYVSNLSAEECMRKYKLGDFGLANVEWIQNYFDTHKICNFHVDAHNLKSVMLNGLTDAKECEEAEMRYKETLKERVNEMNEKYRSMNDAYYAEFKTDIPADVEAEMKKLMKRPIGGLDFASLYPSIMRAYNLSPEKMLTVFSVGGGSINKLIENPALLRECNIKLDKLAETYNAGMSKFKFIKRPIVYCGHEINAYVLWHNNKTDIDDAEFGFGLFPYILNKLFNFRLIFKRKLKEVKETIEKGAGNLPASELDELKKTEKYYNSKQNAVKLLMNCFYGATGQQGSPINMLELAANVTNLAQHAIKYARKVVLASGCKIYYGDTDSIYLSVAEACFNDIDVAYYSGRIKKRDYWYKCVELSFREVKRVKSMVDSELAKMSDGTFLSMDYEEFLWPCIMCAKKKYVGREHMGHIDFEKNKVFVRGLEFKKRGASDLLKELSNWVIGQILSPENIYDMLSLVKQAIDSIYNEERPIKVFAKSANYRPDKANIAVNEFAKRMIDMDITMMKNDRFMYVVCETYPWKYDVRGCQVEIKKSDKMELLETAERCKKEIDKSYYIEGEISGALGVFLTYHDMFHVDPENNGDEAQKKAEMKIRKNAKKWIVDYASQYFKSYKNNGTVLKGIYHRVNGILKTGLNEDCSNLYDIVSKKCNLEELIIEIAKNSEVKARKKIGVEKEDYRFGYQFLNEYSDYEINAAEFKGVLNSITSVSKDVVHHGCSKKFYSYVCEVEAVAISLKEYYDGIRDKIKNILIDIKTSIIGIKRFFQSYNTIVNRMVTEYKHRLNIVDETIDLEGCFNDVDDDDILRSLKKMAQVEYDKIKEEPETKEAFDIFDTKFNELVKYQRRIYKYSNVMGVIQKYHMNHKNIADPVLVADIQKQHKESLLKLLMGDNS